MNAVRHGLSARSPVIPGVEQDEDWQRHLKACLEDLAPVGYIDTQLATQVAELLWRRQRVAPYEAAVMHEGSSEFMPLDRLGGTHLELPSDNRLATIQRHDAHISKQLFQTLHELEVRESRRRGEATPLARIEVHGLPETG